MTTLGLDGRGRQRKDTSDDYEKNPQWQSSQEGLLTDDAMTALDPDGRGRQLMVFRETRSSGRALPVASAHGDFCMLRARTRMMKNTGDSDCKVGSARSVPL